MKPVLHPCGPLPFRYKLAMLLMIGAWLVLSIWCAKSAAYGGLLLGIGAFILGLNTLEGRITAYRWREGRRFLRNIEKI